MRESRLRILIVTDYYPPFIGGAHIQSQLLSQELSRRGHEIAVATVWQGGMSSAPSRDDGFPVYGVRQLRTLPGLTRRHRGQHHQPPFPDPVTVLGLRRIIKRFEPDIVHSFGWISYSCAIALAGRSTPLLITARDYAYGCANRTLMRDGVECSGPALAKCLGCAGRNYGRPKGWVAALGVLGSRPLLRRRVQAVHSISEYVKLIVRRDFLAGRSSEETVIHDVIGNPLAEEQDGPVERQRAHYLELLPSEPFVLFVGALRRVKGVAELLAAYEGLSNPPPLVLIGTLERDTPPIPANVHVLEDVPHAAVMAAWDRALFGVFPSNFPEPLGTVVCEAMSRAKPVIGTAPGGHTDMITDGETGLIVPRGDVPALRAAMQMLTDDPELRTRLGEAARVRAAQFTAGVSIPRIERLYETLLAAQGRPPH